MNRDELHRAIARQTGDSIKTIRRRGFSIVEPNQVEFDPEPNQLPPQMVDWDEADRQRQAN